MMFSEENIRDALLINNQSRDSYLLYGSYARGDYESGSDVDVLCVTTMRKRAQRLNGRVTLHIYDINDLLASARLGGLFILHLIREAKPIHDPCGYLQQLSEAFQKPDSYTSNTRRALGPATAILDISESLFGTAPEPFMRAALFLCRTLVYAEHADREPFCFSMRELAVKDETASMICKMKNDSVSYSNFKRLRQVVRGKVESSLPFPDALSVTDLAQRIQGNLVFDSLLRRILEGLGDDSYVMPDIGATDSLNRSSASPIAQRGIDSC